jgi:hypothetical protein
MTSQYKVSNLKLDSQNNIATVMHKYIKNSEINIDKKTPPVVKGKSPSQHKALIFNASDKEIIMKNYLVYTALFSCLPLTCMAAESAECRNKSVCELPPLSLMVEVSDYSVAYGENARFASVTGASGALSLGKIGACNNNITSGSFCVRAPKDCRVVAAEAGGPDLNAQAGQAVTPSTLTISCPSFGHVHVYTAEGAHCDLISPSEMKCFSGT